jgi:galactonate dehydratase
MKITDISVKIFAVPGDAGRPVRRNWIFVRIDTDEGLYGIGEATTEYFTKAVEAAIVDDIKPVLIGQDPTRIEYIWQLMQRLLWWRGGVVQTSAMSGIDHALWDITGKAYGQPVYKLLGGAVRDRVQLYPRPDLGLGSFEAEMANMKEEGFTACKGGGVQMGLERQSPKYNVQRAEQLAESVHKTREIAGPDMELMLDMGGIMPRPMAAKFLQLIEPDNMLFVEEVVNADTPRDLKQMREAFPSIAMASGERINTRWGFREWLEVGAVDIIQPDISHCGGISEMMKIANMAEVYNVRVAPHGPYGPVNKAAGVHAAAAMPNFLILEHCRMPPWYDDVQTQGLTIKNGYAELPTAPGLGVDLDWDLLDKYPFQQGHPIAYYTREDGSEPLV